MGCLYLYAITERSDEAPPAVTGIAAQPVFGLPVGELLAYVSQASPGQVPLSRANLLCHEAVVESLMDGRGVLPARFGTMIDAQQLALSLEQNGAAYTALLGRVQGRVELALRVIDTSPGEERSPRPRGTAAADGRSYLRALLAAEQRGQGRRSKVEALAEQIATELGALAEAALCQRPSGSRLLLKGAYLVRRDAVEALRSHIAEFQAAHPELALLVTGPWPAYSFTELD